MSGIIDGQPVNAAASNASWMARNGDTDTIGKVALNNVSYPASGAAISNAQQAINETFDAVGISGVGDTSRKVYSSNNALVNGQSHKQGLENLDVISPYRAGIVILGLGQYSATIVFSSSWPNANYQHSVNFECTDSEPIFITSMVTSKGTAGMTVLFNAATDSVNYKLNYRIGKTL